MNRRGLSLIEVLAATALMAVMAGAFVPLFAAMVGVLRNEDSDPTCASELGLLADQVLADPQAFGLTPAQFRSGEVLYVTWPGREVQPPVVVRLLVAQDAVISHAWLIFSAHDDGNQPIAVCRWIDLSSHTSQVQP